MRGAGLQLPPAASRLRSLIEAGQIPEPAEAPLFGRARRDAIRTRRAVTLIVLRGNDDLCLVRFGPRGGHRCLWNFTAGRTSY